MNLLAEQQWTGRIFTGMWHPADGGVSSVVEPATGRELGTVGLASATDMARAVAGAQQAQRAWAAASFGDRAAVLRRAAELWARHSEEIQTWLIREGGSTRSKARYEVRSGESECLEAVALPSHPVGDVLATDHALLSMSRRVPVGVVGVIAPFNGPIKLAIRSVAPALALGNAVVLKPDPRTAVCGGVTIARVFEEAGLPPGVLHVLAGGGDAGAALVADPAVSAVSFTGSTSAGRPVGEAAARHLARAHLELGGNNALIVLGDADIDRAVNAAAHGTFFNAGQACMASGRHLVHESVYDEYVHKLAARASELTVGDPYTRDVALGPIIDARQRDKIHDLVTKSVDAGARLLAGGTYDGLFYRPTVLADARKGIPAYDNEVFGPVAPVARFATIDEAAQLAADSEYGLALGVLTADMAAGLELVERIPTGIAHVNDQTVNDDTDAPFGGVRDSGSEARFGGAAANIEAYTDVRWISADREIPAYAM